MKEYSEQKQQRGGKERRIWRFWLFCKYVVIILSKTKEEEEENKIAKHFRSE